MSVCLCGWVVSPAVAFLSYQELEVLVSSVLGSHSCQLYGLLVSEQSLLLVALACLDFDEGEVHLLFLQSAVCVFPFLFVDLVVMYVLASICFMSLVFVGEWLAPLFPSYFMLLRMSSLSSSVSSRLLRSLKPMYLFSPRIVFAVSISSSSL